MAKRNLIFAIFAIIAIIILSFFLWPGFEATGKATQVTVSQVAVIGNLQLDHCLDLKFWKCIRTEDCRWNWRGRICELKH